MTRCNFPTVAVLLVLAVPAAAATGNLSESLADWEWYQEVHLPAGAGAGRLVDLVVPPGVFDKSQESLADLRLYDGGGRAVPYALRVRRAENDQHLLPAREFNRAVKPDRSAELSLDLGEKPGEHNEVRVTTPGKDFRRRLRLEGSNDGREWSSLLDGVYVVHFQVDSRLVEVNRFSYPASRFRYLRLQVFPDRGLEDDKPAITAAGIYRSIRTPGEDVTLPANLGAREAVPAEGGPGSAWLIDFGDRVPCERLSFDVGDEEFVRPYQLEVADPGEPRRFLVRGEWHRRRGEERRPLEVPFPEAHARRLRLVVTDFRNPPLSLQAARYSAPARQVVFAPPADLTSPLRLYFGNPQAQPPHYDFASTLPARLEPPPARAALEQPTRNPDYSPPPRPWTERWPWLVYAVLSVASLVLLAVLAALAREAVRRHDAGRPAAEPTSP